MSEPVQVPPPGFDDLSIDERIDYLSALWDRIAARPDQVPMPEWHRKVIDERAEAHRESPNDVRPWTEVRDRVRKKLRESKG